MKKIIFSLVATVALGSVAFAGKNVAIAPVKPLPVPLPQKPIAPQMLNSLMVQLVKSTVGIHTD